MPEKTSNGRPGNDSDQRHEVAIANSLARAQLAADDGLYDDALAWLDVVQVVDGGLAAEWQRRRRAWLSQLDGAPEIDTNAPG